MHLLLALTSMQFIFIAYVFQSHIALSRLPAYSLTAHSSQLTAHLVHLRRRRRRPGAHHLLPLLRHRRHLALCPPPAVDHETAARACSEQSYPRLLLHMVAGTHRRNLLRFAYHGTLRRRRTRGRYLWVALCLCTASWRQGHPQGPRNPMYSPPC